MELHLQRELLIFLILNAIDKLLSQIQRSTESLMIYGTGKLYNHILPHLKERNIQVECLIDSRADNNSFYVDGEKVIPLREALKGRNKAVILIASAALIPAINP